MKIVVLKFGGTSVGTTERIKKVANIIISYVKKRYKVIVVSSAMRGTTNDLVKKSKTPQYILGKDSISQLELLLNNFRGDKNSCGIIVCRQTNLCQELI